jgi:chitin disaccharide deacetylase
MKLIINADDFGQSDDINNTILWLHKNGIVSSATIIAKGLCFKKAVDISKDNPNLGIGVHLCLDGPFNIGTDYDTILDADKSQFLNKTKIITKLRTFAVDESEIYKEYCLLIGKVLDHGIKISHLDHHHHLHLYPSTLRMMIKAAKKFKISFIRSQKIVVSQNINLPNHLYRNIHQFYLKKHLNTTDGYFIPGLNSSSNKETSYNRLLKLISQKRGIVEIVLHPVSAHDPETAFFMENSVADLLKKQVIMNFNNLKYT